MESITCTGTDNVIRTTIKQNTQITKPAQIGPNKQHRTHSKTYAKREDRQSLV